MPANINGGADEVLPPGAAFVPTRPVPDGDEGSCAAQSGTSSQSAGHRPSRGKFCRRARHFFPHDPPTGREGKEPPPNPPLTRRRRRPPERPPTPAVTHPPHPPPSTSARPTAPAAPPGDATRRAQPH